MTSDTYYIAPKQDIFEEVKKKAIELWQTYDDTHGYATGKINRIKDIENVSDNTCYIVAMFDHNNQLKLLRMVNDETAAWLNDLLIFACGG